MKYRPDIDGLRAIAVISVILFHLNEKLLPVGFVGVDIFFVISGYLITKLITREIYNTGTFKFSSFYLRRLRRLFPALLFTFLFCFVFSYKLFSPQHLAEFGQSLTYATLSISNIFFWSGSSYFDTDSQFKPLLHIWSLSIEEQFYFIWPTLLFLLSLKKKKLFTSITVTILGVLSLLLNIYFFSNQQELTASLTQLHGELFSDIQSTVFYLLPFRVFEFVIGAILVWLHPYQKDSPKLNGASFITGMLMIGYSLFAFNAEIPFPSVHALIPCMGAALIIFSGPSHRLVFVLNNRTMVFVGLISYSLYLIHWPVIVFYKYWRYGAINRWDQWIILLSSFLIACLMYRFVEQPFRKAKGLANRRGNRLFVGNAIMLSIVVLVVSHSIYSSEGWLWRYPKSVAEQLNFKKGDYDDYVWGNLLSLEKGFSNNGKPKVLIIGDSMAADLTNVIVAGGGIEDIDLTALPIKGNCKGVFPLPDKAYKPLYQSKENICRAEHKKVLDSTLLQEADAVILASYWWEVLYVPYIKSTVDYLHAQGVENVYVLGLKNQYPDGIKFLVKHVFAPNNHKIRTPPHENVAIINNRIKNLNAEFEYFSLLEGFCNESGCQRITKEGYLIIFDGSHLTPHGAKMLGKNLGQTEWFKSLLKTKTPSSDI